MIRVRSLYAGFVFGIIAIVLSCPPLLLAETKAEDEAFERGYELGRRTSESDNRLIASGYGVSVGSTRYSFRDWDEAWGLSVAFTPWNQIRIGEPDSEKSSLRLDGIRVGWFPLDASFDETVTISRVPQTITRNIGFSLKGNAYFIQSIGAMSYPLTQSIRIPLRVGFGFTWFDLQETDHISIDGVDYTAHFQQDVDALLDVHLLLGVGLEVHTVDPAFAAGVMVGYRLTIWELWKLETSFTDPSTGRENTIRDHGSEFLDGSARGMTVDVYLRYLF